MTRRFNFLFVLALAFAMCSTTLTAQPFVSEQSSDDEISELTKDPKYPVDKPNDMWELGLHAGMLGYGADTQFKLPFPGFGGGLSVRKSLGYTFSLRAELLYGQTYGQDYTGYWSANQPVGALTSIGYTSANPFVFNYKSTYTSFGIQALYTLTNIKFHTTAPKLGIYGLVGIGGFKVNTKYDAKNASGVAYDYSVLNADKQKYDMGTITLREYRKAVRDVLSQTQDRDYETDAAALTVGQKEVKINSTLQAGFGIAYRLNDKISLALEPQFHLNSNDFLDGRKFDYVNIASNGGDVPFYLPVRLNVFLGDTKKQSIPLWWVNPIDAPRDAIAANTKKVDAAEMLADKDNDGVPNMIDKEPDTPAGAEVDTRGVTLDSDKDGLPNHLDKEPYSPVGYKIDPKTGISEKPVMPKTMSKEDVLAIGKDAGWGKATSGSSVSEWFLPMIHFDNDRYTIKPTSYSALGEVAAVMQKYPSITVVVEGHASSEASTAYNSRLSYKRAKAAIDALVTNYGIDRSRFILRYDGESEPLIKNATTNYMNRRVEFRVSNGETEMSAPN